MDGMVVLLLVCSLSHRCFSRWSSGRLGLSVVSRLQEALTGFFGPHDLRVVRGENEAFLVAGCHFHENHKASPDSKGGEIDSPF